LKNQTPNVFINTITCLRSIAGRSHDAPGPPSHSDLELHQHSRLDLSHKLGDLAARGTLIGHVCCCQDPGLSWKSTSSRAGCVYASHRGLDKHLSDRSLWADCHSVGRKPGNIRRSFAGRAPEQKSNDFVPFGFVLCRLGFVRRHRVSDDGVNKGANVDDGHSPPANGNRPAVVPSIR